MYRSCFNLSVSICQTIYEAQVMTLATNRIEWIERQEELTSLKPAEIVRIGCYKNCNLGYKLAKTIKTSDGKFHSINYIETHCNH